MNISFFFRWYDLWIGVFVDTKKKAVYICPVPCFGIKVSWAGIIEVEAIRAVASLQDVVKPLRDELRALRALRETCGMYCEQLPVEVREALHSVPEIEKTHGCSFKVRR